MQKRTLTIGIVTLACAIFLTGLGISGDKMGHDMVDYPDGYRDWTHVKTMVIQEGHPLYEAVGGIHHVYGNDKAIKGYKGGKQFSDGSVIVFDLFEAKAENNAIVEGSRLAVIVMEKDSKKFSTTGGWGFESFKGDTMERTVKDPNPCFDCHKPQKENDYVFSTYRK